MGLNKQKGNMYAFVTHTWNPIRGKCPHDCSYCYMRTYPQGDFRFVEKEMETNLGEGNFIFVGSSTDMWVGETLGDWVLNTLRHCCKYPLNRYLFQSKNPARFLPFIDFMPADFILGTTIETNRDYEVSQAPTPEARALAMYDLPMPKMISIEPIMNFDMEVMMRWISDIKPEFVSVGADSKGHKLPEPDPLKIAMLVKTLKEITTVKVKDNLKRLLEQ